jgi:hypothetical protein
VPEIQQTDPQPDSPTKADQNPLKAAVALYKRLPVGLRRIATTALIGFLGIAGIAVFHPSLSERWKFGTDMTLNLLILFAIAVQAYIYSGQWQSMKDSLERTDRVIDKMEDQLKAVDDQAEIMRKQAETMDQSLVFGTRAYVGVHSIVFNPHKKRILLQIENIGRVPAKDIEVIIELMIHIPDHLMPPPAPDGTRRGWELKPSREQVVANVDPAIFDYWELRIPWLNPFGRTKLFPGSLKLGVVIRLDEIFYITPAQYQSITAGNAKMFVRGMIRYSDGFHSGKRTEFAFRYYLKDDLWIAIPETGFDLFQSEPEKPDKDYNPN